MTIKNNYLYLISFLIIFLFASCKQEAKQKIDHLPDVNLEELEALINNPQTAKKNKGITTDGPRLQIEDQVFEFGEINPGDKVNHQFKLKNIGNKKLIFLNLKPSCGCTVAEKPDKALFPGEEYFLEVEFDSKGKSGDQFRKIAIFTNSYPNENYIEMRGTILDK